MTERKAGARATARTTATAKTNTGVLHCVQDDGEKRAKAKAKARAGQGKGRARTSAGVLGGRAIEIQVSESRGTNSGNAFLASNGLV
jgi:hypothetical protein